VSSQRCVIRALVVQDSSPRHTELVDVLRRAADISVIGESDTAADAIDQVARTQPDVVILDLLLQDGHGQLAIEQIMAHTPTPILVLSAGIDDRQSRSVAAALVAGAVDVLPTPQHWTAGPSADLLHAVRQLSKVHVIRHPRGRRPNGVVRTTAPAMTRPAVVAIAASTGGPSAIATVLAGLGDLNAPVLVVQHLHPDFTPGLVDWMARVAALPVEQATHGQLARPGHIYFAPGDRHLRYGPHGRLELDESPVTVHRPSADELFRSVAAHAGAAGIGVLLTGMGDDGAKGLLAMREQGGNTLAQDEASSAVFGMPKAAQRIGAVREMLAIDKIAAHISRAVREVRP
jgi:two-component system, chemotaxis family, protein-glutamate methylesterase/glutaminase